MIQEVSADILRAYMELYWLRPEVALWRTVDALSLREVKLEYVDLDLGCGNGLNSYVLSGARLPLEVDEFLDAKVTGRPSFRAGLDIYDAPPSATRSVPAPQKRIRYGLDWKQNLLEKARQLQLYERLIQHDANLPIPLTDRSVRSFFSNILYWIERIEIALAEIARILADGGAATLLLPDASLRDFFIYHKYVTKCGWGWMAALDMGRHTHFRHMYALGEWERRFRSAGLRIKEHRNYLSSRLMEIHEVGLRPLSPVLIRMANSLSPIERSEIKREWVEYCMCLALPMFTSGWLDDPELPRVFHVFVVERT